MENNIKQINDNLALQSYQTLQNELIQILENQQINEQKQNKILEITQQGFIGLAIQNSELIESNKKLTQQFEAVVIELNQLKQEREEKECRKKARMNRKRLPKRATMTKKIYKELIQESEGPTYINLRLRLALCILAVTGIRINELLNIRVSQLKTLTQEYWTAIDRSKRGPSSHKAFLTKEGKKIIEDRKKDFERMFAIKESDAFVFTSEATPYKTLRREILTKNVNQVMRKVSKKLPEKPNITSHSFRIGYITQLWKDSKDIEFVKQTIGHQKLDTTSSYVIQLSDEERKQRISDLK